LAEKVDFDELRIHALTSVGSAKIWLDGTGHAELNLALDIAKATNSPLAVTVLNNLGVLAVISGDVVRAEELNLETLSVAQRMGDGENIRFSRANLLYSSMFRGGWDETLENADRFIAECETSPHNMENAAREMRGAVRLARGNVEGALDDLRRALALARELKDPTRVLPGLLGLARGLALVGRVGEARALVSEALEIARDRPTIASVLGLIAGEARMLGVDGDLVEVLASAPDSPWREAALAEARGERLQAADMYKRMGAPAIEADVRFGAAEQLLEEGQTAEGLAELDKALAFYRSVSATLFIERGETLAAAVQRDSA
jgi:tetratricopeptide (TPR) repeat protein